MIVNVFVGQPICYCLKHISIRRSLSKWSHSHYIKNDLMNENLPSRKMVIFIFFLLLFSFSSKILILCSAQLCKQYKYGTVAMVRFYIEASRLINQETPFCFHISCYLFYYLFTPFS